MKVTPEVGFSVPERTEAPTKEMLSVRRGSDGKYFVRTNYSSFSVVQTCTRKAQYMLHEGWRSRSESPATLFGSAVHKALECFYSAPRAERTLPEHFEEVADTMIAGLPEGHSAQLLYRCIAAFLTHAEPLRALPDNDKRSLSSGVWLLCHYFRTYIDDPFTVLADERGPITERFCEAVLHDSPDLQITLFGTIDVVLRNETTGVILPCDHKTFSTHSTDFYNRLKPNLQYSTYAWLAKEALGLDVAGFLVNGLEVKARPIKGKMPTLPRQVTKRTEEDFAELKQSIIFAVGQYLACLEGGHWPQADVNACAMYGKCQYHDVCSSPFVIKQSVLEANFMKGKADASL